MSLKLKPLTFVIFATTSVPACALKIIEALLTATVETWHFCLCILLCGSLPCEITTLYMYNGLYYLQRVWRATFSYTAY